MNPPRLNVAHRDDYDRTDEHRADDAECPSEVPAAVRGPAGQHGLPANIAVLPSADRREQLRILEALLFAAREPQDEASLARYFKPGQDVLALLEELKGAYAGRGINLVRVAGKWIFRTAEDLSYLLERHAVEQRRLSRAALETLAIIAYHQPVTRAEIEEIRGVQTSKGTLDVLLETGWVKPRGRRRAPGKPLTYGTTDRFLEQFGLDNLKELPGLADLKGAGLLDGTLPADFKVPSPGDLAAVLPDELPLDDTDGAEPETQSELDLDLPSDEEADNGPGGAAT
ncbi:MAG TPA: SMC-Scp complex subunit ScpB [Hyphomicrobiaceae bacterium]|nr:SMC-Scp complex subunit ScpB [Hyphomicrobiaceae bacterium]